MSRYGVLRREYDSLVKEELKKNDEILKESFIEYFGEENRALIESRFKEIVYIYYINWDTITLVCRKSREEDRDKFKPYFDFYEARDDLYCSFVKDQIFPNNFIGTTDEDIFLNVNIYIYVLERLKKINPYSRLKKDYLGTKRLICFNLFLTSEEAFIHEIGHAITSSWIFKVIKDNTEYIYEKTGLRVNDDGETPDDILEELINDKMSLKIYEIFKRRGGDLSSFLMGGIYGPVYSYNHYLVDKFFDAFEDLLKEVRIGENKNHLLKKVGKESYDLLCSLINEYYVTEAEPPEGTKECNLNRIHSVVDYMEEYVKFQEDLSDDDINRYYQYLESLGKKVTILNKK